MERADITGVVLAGGRGSRMGGVDKGLQLHHGVPLALHALRRLRPQVGRLLVNANRNPGAYGAMGAPVVADAAPDFAGPLAGFLAALTCCETPYLVTVPCDSPLFPPDLVARLAAALESGDADLAVAASLEHGRRRMQPVFCLMRAELRDSLARFMAQGGHRVADWMANHARAVATFDDEQAFLNANTLDELQQLQAAGTAGTASP